MRSTIIASQLPTETSSSAIPRWQTPSSIACFTMRTESC
jgi:hypothetical protein